MTNPIVIAHHLIWTVYGWWLPNDPRGSTSTTVRSSHIAALGELHFGRKKVQPASRDVRAFYEQAAQALKHPLLEIRDHAADVVATAFGDVIARERYTCYACAIMPDHVQTSSSGDLDTTFRASRLRVPDELVTALPAQLAPLYGVKRHFRTPLESHQGQHWQNYR